MRFPIVLIVCLAAFSAFAKDVWTDPGAADLPADFAYQGEYAADGIGVQVISLGNVEFHAVVYPGGLPGAGWDKKRRSLMAGKLEGGKVTFSEATGKRRYNGNSGAEFSATPKFPPAGHAAYSATTDGKTMALKGNNGEITLKKAARTSETMGAKPPKGAIVLFDGSSKDAFAGGRLDDKTKLLNTDGMDIRTKQKFSNYTMHVEFMLPYRPKARGQGRGNSGFYQIDMYEMQVLDSFGLNGENNECGGIYKTARPAVNMCLPPLTWQTYDVEFTNAVAGPDGKKTKNARFTARHNGVLIHDDLELPGKTGGSRRDAEGTPGPMKFQGHGNPLQYRNIWIVPKD
jgi:hypothetical protein